MNPQMMMMQQQQMQQQMQQQQQMMQAQAMQGAGGGGAKPAARPTMGEVRVIANARMNSLIIHAHPRQLRTIAGFIKKIDVPSNRSSSLEAQLARVQVYRLVTLDAAEIAESLAEMEALDPTTRVDADATNNALIVDGSLADHFTIKKMLDKLDGSGRRFEVLTLRRLPAEHVAGSIEFLMGSAEKKSNSSSYQDMMWGMYPSRNSGNKQNKDEFRVASNAEYNQVLLWCNDNEYEQVEKLLVKLGEIADPRARGGSQIRTIEASDGEETREFLRELKRRWPSISPNPLILPELPLPEVKKTEGIDAEIDDKDSEKTGKQPPGRIQETRAQEPPAQAQWRPRVSRDPSIFRFVGIQQAGPTLEAASDTVANAAAAAAVGPDGGSDARNDARNDGGKPSSDPPVDRTGRRIGNSIDRRRRTANPRRDPAARSASSEGL
jgi:hypothetical protein